MAERRAAAGRGVQPAAGAHALSWYPLRFRRQQPEAIDRCRASCIA
jgi:hypothetical protein